MTSSTASQRHQQQQQQQVPSSFNVYVLSSDVTIIESKIEIEFFLKIELNQNRFCGWYFFDFDSRLYWQRQRTAASSENDS